MADTGTPTLPTYRVLRATNTLPQSAQAALFTVTGRVKIIDIVGEVTTQIEGGANVANLVANPTVGADVDITLAAGGLDIDADAVGTLYSATGTFANAMIATTSGAFEGQANPFIVAAGTLDLKCTASKTGSVKWTVLYQPVDPGSKIVAA